MDNAWLNVKTQLQENMVRSKCGQTLFAMGIRYVWHTYCTVSTLKEGSDICKTIIIQEPDIVHPYLALTLFYLLSLIHNEG